MPLYLRTCPLVTLERVTSVSPLNDVAPALGKDTTLFPPWLEILLPQLWKTFKQTYLLDPFQPVSKMRVYTV